MGLREQLQGRIGKIVEDIENAAESCGRRREDIRLVAATKTRSVQEMNWYEEEIRLTGLPCIFGENYVQEFRSKANALEGQFQSHFIGRLQSNKARDAIELFDVIESVDSSKLAKTLAKEASKLGKRQVIYLQVNISNDPKKGGFSLDGLEEFLAEDASSLKMLEISGLMAITEFYENPEEVRQDYLNMRLLRERMLKLHPSVFASEVCHLSMGMSGDFTIAIEEGATVVRIGSALFGPRL